MTEQPGYRDADTLSQLYHDEGLKQREIAERFGVGQGTISDWMSRLDIQSRSRWKITVGEDKLREMYYGENMSLEEIGDDLGYGAKMVQRRMEYFDIPRRDNTYSRRPVHFTMNKGYLTWHPTLDGQGHTISVHRLVAVAEYGLDAVIDKVVHHKNRHKIDNRPENLELMTRAEHNREHAEEAFGDE